jgi:hypothetical protein
MRAAGSAACGRDRGRSSPRRRRAGGWAETGALAGSRSRSACPSPRRYRTDRGVAPTHAICRVREARVMCDRAPAGFCRWLRERPHPLRPDEVTPAFSIDNLSSMWTSSKLLRPRRPDLPDSACAPARRWNSDDDSRRLADRRTARRRWPFVAGGCNVGGFSIAPAVGDCSRHGRDGQRPICSSRSRRSSGPDLDDAALRP